MRKATISVGVGVAGLVSRTVVGSGYDPIDCAAALPDVPKLFMCGRRDPIVDYQETERLHAKARDPKEIWILEDGSHTEALIDNSPDDDDPSRRAYLSSRYQAVGRTRSSLPRRMRRR